MFYQLYIWGKYDGVAAWESISNLESRKKIQADITAEGWY